MAIYYVSIGGTVVFLLVLLIWPTWRLIHGAWCRVQSPPPGAYNFMIMTWEDGVTDEMIREAGAKP